MSRAAGQTRPREAALAALFFLAVTAAMTWPQIAHLPDRLNDLWDAKQNAWILHWDFTQTFRDPARLFQAPILHPARYALAFSENLYGAAVFGFPLLALGAPILVNYNVVFLLGMAFSAWSAWLLARYVTGDAAASLLAGLIFAFVPWRFAQLPHINMQWGGFLCLLFLFLLRYLDAGRRRDLVLFAACFALNLLATLHFGLFSGFLIGVTLLFEAFAGGPEQRRRIPMVLIAAAVATLACAPFLLPYRMAERLYGMRRRIEEMEAFSAKASDFLSAGSRNRLYGALTFRWTRGEGDLFPGLVPLLLAASALLGLRGRAGEAAVQGAGPRHPKRRAALLVCVAAVGLVVAFGAHTPLYRFLFLHVGSVFRAIRVPARGIVLFHMALALLAAWGLSLWTRRLASGARRAGLAAALALVAVEYRAFPLELFEYDAQPRPVYAWLGSAGAPGAVIEWPLGFPYDPEWMLRQAEHGRPLVNGHQSYFPPAYQRLVHAMRARPIAPAVWDEIAQLGAGTLIFHQDQGGAYDRVRYRRLLREGLAEGRLQPMRAFREGDSVSFVFRLSGAAPGIQKDLRLDDASQRELDALLSVSDADAAPPTGLVHVPAEGQVVAPGFWGFGWAVDDSGIALVRVATEVGPAGVAQLGGKWPNLAAAFPDLPDSEHGGYGFPVPDLAPGAHTLKITLVGRDGGETLLERRIVVVPAANPAKP